MKVNFTDVPDVVFDPPPAGTYLVTIAAGEVKESGDEAKHPGTPYINWDFVIVSDKDGDTSMQGRHIFSITSMHPDALQYGLKPLLKAVGGINVDGEIDFEIEDLVNKQVMVKGNIKSQEGYDDKFNIRRFYSLSDDAVAANGNGSLLPS